MKRLLTNNVFLIVAAIACVATGVASSFAARDFTWLARFGAVIVGIGVVALSRTFILKRDLLLDVGSADNGMNLNGPDYYASKGEPAPDYVKEDLRSRFALGVVGPILSFTGSLIWAFSDLLNKVVPGFGVICI